ncbi:hypothetical protein [Escherichia coli]|uniref:hypothetical protein n=1 Tax=Escherichia coli TaxID=562 RepID=UPI003075B528
MKASVSKLAAGDRFLDSACGTFRRVERVYPDEGALWAVEVEGRDLPFFFLADALVTIDKRTARRLYGAHSVN